MIKTDDSVAQLCRNAWNWDFPEFCRRLGISEDEYSRQAFIDFNKAATLLNKFDTERLAILCSNFAK